ncbi:MAG: biopolymer transporter ExbD [Acidobacteriia bacterium]|nr:biopolymer transporter ExbD [Terriglobia bacterium]
MAFSTAGGGPSTPQMNVTPLIDVLLVLIIIFMVVVTQQKEKGLEAQIPQQQQGENQPPPPQRTIVIQVVGDAQSEPPVLTINQESVSWEGLKVRLQDIFKRRAERIAFVRGDNEVAFQYVADVIDIARDAGVNRVGLLGGQR